jgi:alpha-1,2-mannosyltransferase
VSARAFKGSACWIALAVSIALYVVLSLMVFHQPFHVGARRLRYFDLRVYRGAAERIMHGKLLYGRPIMRHLGFTYPPVTALAFVPLTFASLVVDERVITVVNILLLLCTLRWTVAIWRSSGAGRGRGPIAGLDDWAVAALGTAFALWLEPVSTTIGYGQIDLAIAALVVFDISRPDSAPTKGLAIGLAAGMKLTPLLFIPYLLLSGRRRAALCSIGTFAATIVISFAAVGSDTFRYWTKVIFDTRVVGNIADASNQSLQGATARMTGVSNPDIVTLVVVGVVAGAALALAALASRRGDEATGFWLCALATLLASPISWTHHWALGVPALLLLVLSAHEQRSRLRWSAAAIVAAIGYSYLPELTEGQHRHVPQGFVDSLAADCYVIIGLIAVGAAALAYLGRIRDRDRGPDVPVVEPGGASLIGAGAAVP